MRHDWKTKEGSPNLGSLPHSPSAWRTPSPNMHHLFSRQHQCSRGRLQDVFRARRKPRMNVCLISWQTSRRARPDLFNQWGINWPQFAPHCTRQQIFPSCTKPVQCSVQNDINIESKIRRNPIMLVCGERCQFVRLECRYFPPSTARSP